MAELFLLPIINLFDVHDIAVRDWLSRLDDSALNTHLEYPFRLERFFPVGARRALMSVNEVHDEIVRLLDLIDPNAVFLDIPVDFIELENKYNKRLVSPLEFWSEYYQISAGVGGKDAIYCIYIKGIIDKQIRLIETREHLPLGVVFYGVGMKARDELIPIYEDILDRDGEFVLHSARTINEITQFRELPKHLWYTPMQARHMAVSYEEAEKFYNELLIRLKGLLKFKLRDYMVKSLKGVAMEFVSAYEKFLDYKMREDEMKFSNILKGLSVLTAQSDYPAVVIFCSPMHYCYFLDALRKEKRLHELGITLGDIVIDRLLDKIKPFNQKNRIMQGNYDIALDILGHKKPEIYKTPGSILMPVSGIQRSVLQYDRTS